MAKKKIPQDFIIPAEVKKRAIHKINKILEDKSAPDAINFYERDQDIMPQASHLTEATLGCVSRPVVVTKPSSYERKKKVAVVGSASRTVNKAPYKDPEWEIWQLAWRTDEELKYATRLFDMHAINENRFKIPKNYIELLNARIKTVPVVGVLEDSRIPDLTVYPLAQVTAFLGGVSEYYSGDYFMSSVAYMFALAMYEGYEEIGLFGVDLLDQDEYIHQKPNQEYLIGLARGMGIKVFIPHASALVRGTHRYGYMEQPGDGAITLEALEKKLMEYQAKHQQAYTAVATLDGAIQELTEQVNFLKRKRNGINIGGYHG